MVTKVDKLIVDANAFIKAYPLQEFSSTIYTIPDVIKEIRDAETRRALEVVPYELILLEPKDESIRRATDFSKSTGDYSTLSLVDLKLIALSIDLFEEDSNNKLTFKEGSIKSVVGSGQPRDANPTATTINTSLPIGFHIPNVNLAKYNEHFKQFSYVGKYVYSQRDDVLYDKIMEAGGEILVGGEKFVYLRRWFNHVRALLQESETQDSLPHEQGGDKDEVDVDEISDSDYDSHDNNSGNEHEVEGSSEEEDDDDEGWITPSNYKPKLAESEPLACSSFQVGVLSNDFAIQNVILHTNIPLISPYGRQITTIRSYILRCYTCFFTTSNFGKQFCSRCGNKTLRRISVSTSAENGEMKLHFSAKYNLTAKGKKFSLPKPQGGKHAINPILTEDQHITPNFRSKKAIAREIGPFSLNDVSTRSFVVKNKGQGGCYWNSKNPNATRAKGGRK